jgi:pilus assembly protein CpaE
LLFDEAETVYLVTQVGIAELRNANRLITEYFKGHSRKLQVVLNRFTPRTLSIDEESINRALTKPAEWKIPGDYPAARKAQDKATPLALEDSPISRVVKQMARKACDLPAVAKKKRFLFGK